MWVVRCENWLQRGSSRWWWCYGSRRKRGGGGGFPPLVVDAVLISRTEYFSCRKEEEETNVERSGFIFVSSARLLARDVPQDAAHSEKSTFHTTTNLFVPSVVSSLSSTASPNLLQTQNRNTNQTHTAVASTQGVLYHSTQRLPAAIWEPTTLVQLSAPKADPWFLGVGVERHGLDA